MSSVNYELFCRHGYLILTGDFSLVGLLIFNFCILHSSLLPSSSCSGGWVARAGFGRDGRGRFFDHNFPEFIRGGQISQTGQAEIFKEQRRGAVRRRAAHHLGATGSLDQSALHQSLHDTVHVHAANLFDLGTGDRLAIGDDGERLQARAATAAGDGFFARPAP